ncbi:hypothetical protein GCK32_017841 [Trichostrongylus colubriformis]|uniref:Uncharacterized protein n=1 Tax=Trichostrongylus colubriformis TaxID=6319 RepID=A0AAN8F1Y8_TRICO
MCAFPFILLNLFSQFNSHIGRADCIYRSTFELFRFLHCNHR